jgi:hypothetical protein
MDTFDTVKIHELHLVCVATELTHAKIRKKTTFSHYHASCIMCAHFYNCNIIMMLLLNMYVVVVHIPEYITLSLHASEH